MDSLHCDFIDELNEEMQAKYHTFNYYRFQTKNDIPSLDAYIQLHNSWDISFGFLKDESRTPIEKHSDLTYLQALYKNEFNLAKKLYAEIFNLQEKGDK